MWKLLTEKAVLWLASSFLAHGVRVGFHETKAGDFDVARYGVPNSSFNAGTNAASSVNIACTFGRF